MLIFINSIHKQPIEQYKLIFLLLKQTIEVMNRLICLCNGVRENEIIEAIRTIDLPTLEVIQDKTGAGTNCGRCINTIEVMCKKQISRNISGMLPLDTPTSLLVDEND